MINSGAIMTCSLIKPDFAISDRLDYVENIWKKLTGNTEIYFDDTIYRSERDTSHRNYALAHFMKDMLAFPEDTSIEDTLNFYFQCCSIKLDTSQMSKVAATLANGGICPITNEKIFSPNTVKNCLSVMYSCGMYDFS
jgi:glutaminase